MVMIASRGRLALAPRPPAPFCSTPSAGGRSSAHAEGTPPTYLPHVRRCGRIRDNAGSADACARALGARPLSCRPAHHGAYGAARERMSLTGTGRAAFATGGTCSFDGTSHERSRAADHIEGGRAAVHAPRSGASGLAQRRCMPAEKDRSPGRGAGAVGMECYARARRIGGARVAIASRTATSSSGMTATSRAVGQRTRRRDAG